MATIVHLNTEQARFNPESVFARPEDVVAEPGLTLGQKIATLKRWARDVQERLKSGSEGMPTNRLATPDAALLQAIMAALDSLARAETAAGTAPGEKSGTGGAA
ncbi:MAG: hypothetical protein R3D33_01140 [Hyphomicrobiaceae bacterium]